MDALSKLQEKNKIHSQHQLNANWSVVWGLCLLIPLLFSYAYEFYFSIIKLNELEFVSPLFVLIGSLGFGLPFAAMGDLMLFNRKTKLLFLLIAEAWFTWFWVVAPLSWLAFSPLIAAFVVLQVQLPKIKAGG